MTSPDNNVLKIRTTRFGELDVDRSTVIDIVAGLVGFPQYKSFVILEYTAPFSWLQSTENPELAFVIVNAAEFGDNYVFELPYGDRELDLNRDDDPAVFNIVSIRPNAVDSTVNLKAPVIVNPRTRKGRQIILDDPRFPTRMPLWASEESKGTPEK